MQELIKKNEKYRKYFKHYIDLIKNCPKPLDDQAGNFQKELDFITLLVDNPNATPS